MHRDGFNMLCFSGWRSLSGFTTSTRTCSTLAVTQTLTVDFKLGLAGVSENITVAGASPLIEVTQSLVSATIRTWEVVNLPLVRWLMTLSNALRNKALTNEARREAVRCSLSALIGEEVVW